MLVIYFYSILCSTLLYLLLHHKTHMNKKFIFIDNPIVASLSFLLIYLLFGAVWYSYIAVLFIIPVFSFIIIQIRFWRTPNRNLEALSDEIVSPADGNIIYINKIGVNDNFVSIKKGKISDLKEITRTDLLNKPCWQIGINMTPFDAHKNCSPIDGQIVLSKHVTGVFHSLKDFLSMTENERHTFVIKNEKLVIGVVLIASKRVRRIDSYVKNGQFVNKGEWIGMIRFGSQVDVILPENCNVKVEVGQQVYAIKTIIADY